MTAQHFPTGLLSKPISTDPRHPGACARFAWAAAVACALIVSLGGGTADAKTQRDTEYLYTQVWPTAVRLLRVDVGYTILEKDVDAGYVLFEFKDEGKTFRGAIEIVRLKGESKRVRVIVRIEDRPSYMEQSLLDRLERKLRDENGPPPRRKADPDMDARH